MDKVVCCQNCGALVRVSAEVDQTSGQEEVEQDVTCPACEHSIQVLWPRSKSGWYVFCVGPAQGYTQYRAKVPGKISLN